MCTVAELEDINYLCRRLADPVIYSDILELRKVMKNVSYLHRTQEKLQ